MQMAATWLSDAVPRIEKQYPALLGSAELRASVIEAEYET
jgi:hypothetical protein